MDQGTSFYLTPLGAALITGTVVFFAQRIVEKSFIEPIHQYNMSLGKLKQKLLFYAREIHDPLQYNPKQDKMLDAYSKVSDELRMSWAEVVACNTVINRLRLFKMPIIDLILRLCFKIPNPKNFEIAMKRLKHLMNNLINMTNDQSAVDRKRDQNEKDVFKIEQILGIDDGERFVEKIKRWCRKIRWFVFRV